MKVLCVSELASIHAARWVNQFQDSDWEVYAFQGISRNNGVCPEFKTGRFYVPTPGAIPNQLPFQITLPSQTQVAEKLFQKAFRKITGKPYNQPGLDQELANTLALLIETTQPDLIHSLGLNINWQNMLLSVYRAHEILGKFNVPWIYSSWGADLVHYAQLSPAHGAEVASVLHFCDYHISECERDAALARACGFRGKLLGYSPAFGGVTWTRQQYCDDRPPSSRRTILLKGRDISGGDPQGRAMSVMKAFKLCQKDLEGYRIVICHAAPDVANEAVVLQATTGLNIQVIPHLNYEAWLRIMGSSRLLVAATVTDGLPSTLVEAMSLGALPIHSGLESIQEWIEDNHNGILIPPEDPEVIADALRRGVKDDIFVDQAAEYNSEIVAQRLSNVVVRTKALEMYQQAVEQGKVVDMPAT